MTLIIQLQRKSSSAVGNNYLNSVLKEGKNLVQGKPQCIKSHPNANKLFGLKKKKLCSMCMCIN